jgi:hypothetical protein
MKYAIIIAVILLPSAALSQVQCNDYSPSLSMGVQAMASWQAASIQLQNTQAQLKKVTDDFEAYKKAHPEPTKDQSPLK